MSRAVGNANLQTLNVNRTGFLNLKIFLLIMTAKTLSLCCKGDFMF